MIRFYDISKQDLVIKKKILKSVSKVINNTNFINGKEVFLFEKKFSSFVNSNYSIACSNGTDALTLALKSLNLKQGSEVILPGMTYIATLLSIVNLGLKPILVDIDNNTGLMNINLIKKKINKNTKVIMPVHLYGNIFDIRKLKKIVKNEIFIIEDASQAHGGYFKHTSQKVGSLADLSCFSLYPGKNLGAYGDAGIITTNNKFLKERIIKLGNLGASRDKKYDHDILGFNNRMDTIQAAVLLEKINLLKFYNKKRIEIAKKYNKKIKNKKIKLLNYVNGSVYHQYIILTNNRKKFQKYMLDSGIQTGIHYPKSIRMHKSTLKLFKNINTKVSDMFAKKCVSIPIDPCLKAQEINTIIKKINSY